MEGRRIIFGTGIFISTLLAAVFIWHGKVAEKDESVSYRWMNWRDEEKQGESGKGQNAGKSLEEKARIKTAPEVEWLVEEDVRGSSIGRHFSYGGSYILQERDCLFVAGLELETGAALYGGRNVPEESLCYNIYRLKDDVWDVFVSHPPESVNDERIEMHLYYDETYVKNLVYYEDFLYYNLVFDDGPGEGGDRLQFVYRIPVQGGEAEKLAAACETFYIYNGKIYYMELEENTEEYSSWEYVYCEMEPDGTGRRELYRRKAGWPRTAFAVGGGCLYVEEADGKGITGVNLKTGNMKYYDTPEHIERLYYESGCLYIWVSSDAYSPMTGHILCMDAVSGKKEYLADGVHEAWLENGYLYYTWQEGRTGEDAELVLSVLDLETKQSTTEALVEKGASMLQIVGDDLLVSITVYNNGIKERIVCFRYRAGTLPLDMLDRKEKLEAVPYGTEKKQKE